MVFTGEPEAAAPPAPRAGGEGGERPLAGIRVAMLNFREPRQSTAGGAEEYAWQVSRFLLAQGAVVTFVTGRQRGQRRAEVLEGIRLRRMGNPYLVYVLVPLWLLFHRRRVDAVIDTMNGIPFFSPLVVRRRTPVLCLVHHVHDRQFHAFLPRWLARIGCFVEGPVARLLYRRCLTVTVSESSKQELAGKLRWLAPITVVPNGCAEPGTVAPEPGQGEPTIVYAGRLVGHKRIERVVDLAARLDASWPGLTVHVVGRGPEQGPLARRIADRGLHGRAVLHGYLPAARKNALLGAAHLNVTASEFEGWGLTVIEAAALGVPTVAYDVAGLRDSVRHGVTGWLVSEDECLADVVERALKELSDPCRRAEVADACRAWAREFTWARTGASITALILAKLQDRGGAHQ
ncbi:glycosyltransferase family 4 protein [Nonomuraea sp. B5E05]|uniref:glycosyltransferase family 4 protein n=1 Tax=Nonomuraea sp. B5E05 TaxID=3153569 RepID=UPI003261CC0C